MLLGLLIMRQLPFKSFYPLCRDLILLRRLKSLFTLAVSRLTLLFELFLGFASLLAFPLQVALRTLEFGSRTLQLLAY
jgi:hypothetical protein